MTETLSRPARSEAKPVETRRSLLRRRPRLLAVLAVVGVVGLWSIFCFTRAALEGNRAKSELSAAESALRKHDVDSARDHLRKATTALERADTQVSRMGPVRTIASVTPLVRVQLRGLEAMIDVGRDLTNGATALTDALDSVLHPTDPNASLETTLGPLRDFDAALQRGIGSLESASNKLKTLDGLRLLGPLDGARRDVGRRLTRAQERATDGKRAVEAMLVAMGGNGPRRYLVLAENPDEVRPTGGYVGSYGVIVADGAKVHLERFEGSEAWNAAHPDVIVPKEASSTPFRLFIENTIPQHLSNTNATIDWPGGAALAQKMWTQGGEQPVNGVVLITPDLLVRVLSVTGPVEIPDYDESVDAKNFINRLDFHTHAQAKADQPEGTSRKEFLSAAAEPILQAALHAPSNKWVDLGEELSAAMDAREGMAWSDEATVQNVVADHEWDGRLPDVGGDFVANSDFEFAAKNGRGLVRTFDHKVHVNADGSATIETTMTLENTLPAEPTGKLNDGATMYTVLYGPQGATLDDAVRTDPAFVTAEPPASGHPGAGFLLFAPPQGSGSVHVVWHVPQLIVRAEDGTWRYHLWWRSVPTNSADSVHLHLELPPNFQWNGASPPADFRLDRDVDEEWVIRSRSG